MSGKYKFVVIEGLDGVGKTTTANNLVSLLKHNGENAVLVDMPPKEFETACKYMESSSVQSHFLLYLSIVKKVSDEIEKLIQENHVICARYILSTLAYHYGANVNVHINVDDLKIIKPDFTFLLTCCEEERSKRLISRKNENKRGDVKSLKNISLLKNILNQFYVFGPSYNMIEIDTTTRYQHEILSEIASYIREKSY